LLDENNNNRLDVNERVGYLDSAISANTTDNVLFLSKEKTSPNLRILDQQEISKGQFTVVFNKQIAENNLLVATMQTIADVSKDKSVPWHFGQQRDTLYLYLNTKEDLDTIPVSIDLGQENFIINLVPKQKNTFNPSFQTKTQQQPKEKITLTSDYAIRKTNDKRIQLFDLTDSTSIRIDTVETTQNNILLTANLSEGHQYRINILEEFAQFYNGKQNTKDTFFIQTLNSEKTGEIEIDLQLDSNTKNKNTFFCVLWQNNSFITQKEFKTDTTLTFSYLSPGEYSFFVFEDKNKNQRWDDLHYYKNMSAEPIWRNSTPTEVRAKWKTKGILIITK